MLRQVDEGLAIQYYRKILFFQFYLDLMYSF